MYSKTQNNRQKRSKRTSITNHRWEAKQRIQNCQSTLPCSKLCSYSRFVLFQFFRSFQRFCFGCLGNVFILEPGFVLLLRLFEDFFSFIFQLYQPHFDHFLTETIKSLFLGVTLKNRPQFVAGMVRVILLRTAPSCSLLWVTSLNTGIWYITFFELFGLSFSPYNTIRNALHEQEWSDKKVERLKNKRQMYKCHEP